jgi:hypothetical protein
MGYNTEMSNREMQSLFPQPPWKEHTVVTAEMIKDMPTPVRRYLTYTGVIGKPIVDSVRLKQIGRIRESADKPWMNFDAEQYYTTNPPHFQWIGTIRKLGIPVVRVTDQYQDGKGKLQVKLGSIFPISTATGNEMDQGEMLRYLNEMMWFPTAYLGKNVSFQPIDSTSVLVTLTDRGKSVSATMYFDDNGRLTNFAASRYRIVGGKYELENWSTPISAYGEFKELKLPKKGTAVYHLKSGDLDYIELEVTDLQYNIAKSY